MVRKIFFLFLLLILGLVGVVLVNTWRFESKQLPSEPVTPVSVPDSAIHRFSRSIQFPTISPEKPEDFDSIPFIGFRYFMEEAYPQVHATMKREIVNGYSLLFEWEGTDTSLNPVVLMGHMDVVPVGKPIKQVEMERRLGKDIMEVYARWEVPPFGGVIKDDYIWGRGAIDDKVTVISLMEAAEMLIQEGFQPRRTMLFAFGHDEEIGGRNGAAKIVERLKQRGIEPEFVMDEGGIITREKVPGVQIPVALVGTAEKGYVSVTLSVEMPGGHASMPQTETSIEVLARAALRLREQQFPARISAPVEEFMNTLGPEMPFVQKMAMANRWLFTPLLLRAYEATPAGNATVRTTTAPTIFQSGYKDNVLPPEASLTVNFRILPGETSEDVLQHIRKVVNDERVLLTTGESVNQPSPVSPLNSLGFLSIARTIRSVFPETIVSPYLVVGGTDSKHYQELTPNIYRFMPVADPIGFHDANERVGIEDFKNCVRFNYQLIRNVNQP